MMRLKGNRVVFHCGKIAATLKNLPTPIFSASRRSWLMVLLNPFGQAPGYWFGDAIARN
jgi:hypothetical protein